MRHFYFKYATCKSNVLMHSLFRVYSCYNVNFRGVLIFSTCFVLATPPNSVAFCIGPIHHALSLLFLYTKVHYHCLLVHILKYYFCATHCNIILYSLSCSRLVSSLQICKTKIITYFSSFTQATCAKHTLLLHLISLIQFNDEYKLLVRLSLR
jgi:hypothetical protein